MIAKDTLGKKHIEAEFKRMKMADPAVLERTMHAFVLLERLALSDMPFLFKGGQGDAPLRRCPARLVRGRDTRRRGLDQGFVAPRKRQDRAVLFRAGRMGCNCRKGMKMKHAVSATLAILACSVANATGVSPDEAREAVAGWATLQEALACGTRFDASAIAGVKTCLGADGKGVFYVVVFEGGGYAIASGDTETEPILGYSTQGEWIDDEVTTGSSSPQ